VALVAAKAADKHNPRRAHRPAASTRLCKKTGQQGIAPRLILSDGLRRGLENPRSCAMERHDLPMWETSAIWTRILDENLK